MVLERNSIKGLENKVKESSQKVLQKLIEMKIKKDTM